jgi:hypothetical protein
VYSEFTCPKYREINFISIYDYEAILIIPNGIQIAAFD